MRGKIRVWTKQNEDILGILRERGRYIAKKEYIERKMEEYAPLYLDVYNWYTAAASKIVPCPRDVRFPIWVSLSKEESPGVSGGHVIIEAAIDSSLVITMDIDKWGLVVNNMYIPLNETDKAEHESMLERYGVDDCAAYMSNFYPHIKNKIIKSRERLFDKSIALSPVRIGTIWELRREWITAIIK